jgi:GNAT superfamily N-acetyltransferase
VQAVAPPPFVFVATRTTDGGAAVGAFAALDESTDPVAASPAMKAGDGEVTVMPVAETDFDQLADLREAAMRESLERVGRFNPLRSRERLRGSFVPEHTRWILLAGQKAGFYALRPSPDGMALDHLYLHPRYQRRGIGGVILDSILAEADRAGVEIRVGALKESASNRFYRDHGFVLIREDEWDNYYARPISRPGSEA